MMVRTCVRAFGSSVHFTAGRCLFCKNHGILASFPFSRGFRAPGLESLEWFGRAFWALGPFSFSAAGWTNVFFFFRFLLRPPGNGSLVYARFFEGLPGKTACVVCCYRRTRSRVVVYSQRAKGCHAAAPRSQTPICLVSK